MTSEQTCITAQSQPQTAVRTVSVVLQFRSSLCPESRFETLCRATASSLRHSGKLVAMGAESWPVFSHRLEQAHSSAFHLWVLQGLFGPSSFFEQPGNELHRRRATILASALCEHCAYSRGTCYVLSHSAMQSVSSTWLSAFRCSSRQR